MRTNDFIPHIHVLPEDDANRQLANGFEESLPQEVTHRIRILPVAGGWLKVLDAFLSEHVAAMQRYPNRLMVLLVDFDGQESRLTTALASVPANLRDRVFVLGAWTEPEDLRAHLGSFETIGGVLAEDCRANTSTTWGHQLLQHNAAEITRMSGQIRPILFP